MTTDKADSVHGSRRVEGSLRGCLVNLTSHELAVNSVSITEYARGRVQKKLFTKLLYCSVGAPRQLQSHVNSPSLILSSTVCLQ